MTSIPWRQRLPELGVIVAMLVFLLVGLRLADALPCWTEEVSTLPGPGRRILAVEGGVPWDGGFPLQPSCAAPDAPALVFARSRPNLSLCAGGYALPVMAMSYAASIFSWPLVLVLKLGGDIFAMRKAALLVGLFAIGLTWHLARRFADRRTAALAALLVATNSTFLVVHSMVFFFETMAWTLLAVAIAAWAGCPSLAPGAAETPPTKGETRRLLLGALFFGLSMLASIKTIFLAAPLAVLAWRSGVRLRAIGARRVATMIAVFLLTVAPLAVYARVDPNRGFGDQVSTRLAYIVENLRFHRIPEEVQSILIFATDVLAHLTIAATGNPGIATWMLVVAAPPLAFCVVVAIARLAGRRVGTPLAAAAGALILGYFVVGVLLYRQFPVANYTPLSAVFGAAEAAGVVGIADLLRAAFERRGLRRLAQLPFAPIAALALAAMNLWSVARRGDPAAYLSFPFNAAAERAAASYLRGVPDPGPLVTTTYNHAGVFEVLHTGGVRPVQGYEFFSSCADRPYGGVDPTEAQVQACLLDRWRGLLAKRGAAPLRVITPVQASGVDNPKVVIERLADTLAAVGRELGLEVKLEGRFATAAGEPVIALYRVGAGR